MPSPQRWRSVLVNVVFAAVVFLATGGYPSVGVALQGEGSAPPWSSQIEGRYQQRSFQMMLYHGQQGGSKEVEQTVLAGLEQCDEMYKLIVTPELRRDIQSRESFVSVVFGDSITAKPAGRTNPIVLRSVLVPLTGSWAVGGRTFFYEDAERDEWFALKSSGSDTAAWEGLIQSVAKASTHAGTQSVAGDGAESSDGIWQTVGESVIPVAARRANIVGRYAVVRLNKPSLDQRLKRAPLENDPSARGDGVVITLPLPDGSFGRFRIEASPIIAPELAAAFPEIKSYRGIALDDPTASARLGWTAAGFHAIILTAGGSVYIDPYSTGDLTMYVSYRESDLRNDRKENGPR